MRFLITAGPTREYFDTVRFLTNASSGKMGYACAGAALAVGHEVTLISGPVSLEKPKGAKLIKVVSSEEMAQAVLKEFRRCDCVIMTAAVCDYRPARKYSSKMTKSDGPLSIQLRRTTDILARLGKTKKNQLLIGFAVQDKSPRQNARRKLAEKNLDALVLNHPKTFAADKSDFEILTPPVNWQKLPGITKKNLATRLVKLADKLHRQQSG